jgi:hypothetical protein
MSVVDRKESYRDLSSSMKRLRYGRIIFLPMMPKVSRGHESYRSGMGAHASAALRARKQEQVAGNLAVASSARLEDRCLLFLDAPISRSVGIRFFTRTGE